MMTVIFQGPIFYCNTVILKKIHVAIYFALSLQLGELQCNLFAGYSLRSLYSF